MAAEQTGEPQKRFGISLHWIGIVSFALALISVIAAGTFLLKRIGGDQINAQSAILTVLEPLFSLIGLLSLSQSSRGSQAPASTKMLQINIYNYVNSSKTVSQQSSALSTCDGVEDKNALTNPTSTSKPIDKTTLLYNLIHCPSGIFVVDGA